MVNSEIPKEINDAQNTKGKPTRTQRFLRNHACFQFFFTAQAKGAA